MIHRDSHARRWALLPLLAGLALLLLASAARADDGYLGITMQELDPLLMEAFDLESQEGVLVSDVIEASPAEAAGLQRGDVILGIGGEEVGSPRALRRVVQRADAGDQIEISYLRKGERMSTTATLAESPAGGDAEVLSRMFRSDDEEDGDEEDDDGRIHSYMIVRFGDGGLMGSLGRPTLGVRVEELGEDLGRYFGVEQGLLVLEVFDDTAAAEAGVKVGDVIVELGGKAIDEVGDLHDELEDYDHGDQVALGVVREKSREELSVEVKAPDGHFSVRMPRIERLHPGQHGNLWRWHGDDDSGHRLHDGGMPRVFEFRGEGPDLEHLEKQIQRLEKRLEELTEKLEQG